MDVNKMKLACGFVVLEKEAEKEEKTKSGLILSPGIRGDGRFFPAKIINVSASDKDGKEHCYEIGQKVIYDSMHVIPFQDKGHIITNIDKLVAVIED